MKVTKIDLYNFRCFDRKTIYFENGTNPVVPFIVLIGDNASGKTTILESIAKAFIPILRPINKNVANPDDFKDIVDSDIKIGSKWSAVELSVTYEGTEYSWHNYRRLSAAVDMREIGELKPQKYIKEAINKNLETSSSEIVAPLVVYYSINRMFVDIPRRRSNKQTVLEATEALDNAFTSKNEFRRFYNWFKNEEENELRMHRSKKDYSSFKLNAVRNAISIVLNGYSNLRIEVLPSRMVMDDINGNEFNVMHLSGGYKAIFSLVCDIASRLALAYPNRENPLTGEAVILIDELDLHLHPKWQKTIADDLKRTFPNCQFIVTTHSPFIIQSLSADEVINLEKPRDYRGNYKGWSIDEIQEYEMGVQMKSPDYLDKLKEFENAVDSNDVGKAKSLYGSLDNMLYPGSEIKKILRLDMASIGDSEND